MTILASSTLLAGLAFLAPQVPGTAQPRASQQEPESKPQDAVTLTAKAFRAEHETRDFQAALELWRSAMKANDEAPDSVRVAALRIETRCGIARCLVNLGRPKEAIAPLNEVLRLDANCAEAIALLHWANAKAAEPATDDALEKQARDLVHAAVAKSDGPSMNSLVRMGDVAVPFLSEVLRDVNVDYVGRAARMLASIQTEAAAAALGAALHDPAFRYPSEVKELCSNWNEPTVLPLAEALLDRPEPELRDLGASTLVTHANGLPVERALQIVDRVQRAGLPDTDRWLWDVPWRAEIARALAARLESQVTGADASQRSNTQRFLAANQGTLPADLVTRWTAAFAADRDPAIRVAAIAAEYGRLPVDAAPRRGQLLLRALADGAPELYLWAVERIKAANNFQFGEALHEELRAAVLAALSIPTLSLERRAVPFERLPMGSLTDDARVDLFVRLAAAPADADLTWRRAVRARCLVGFPSTETSPAVDLLRAHWFDRISDPDGRRQWLDHWLTPTNQSSPLDRRALAHLAAADPDRGVRALAYAWLASQHTAVEKLPHLADDLRDPDPSFVLSALNAVGWGEAPQLVPVLRDLMKRGDSVVHETAFRVLATLAGPAAAPDLRERLHTTVKGEEYPFLRELLAAIGPEEFAKELVATVRRFGRADEVRWWIQRQLDPVMRADSLPFATAFLEGCPPELVTTDLVKTLAKSLPADRLDAAVIDQLRRASGLARIELIKLISQWHVVAARSELLKLLDGSEAAVRDEAISALESLREYQSTRDRLLADDSDAIRAALDKAKSMLTSKLPEQRIGAALALAATRDAAALPILLDLLADSDASVRAAATRALERLAESGLAPGATPGADASEGSGDEPGARGRDAKSKRKGA